MVINVSLKKEYIPEWNGNRDSNDQIVVIHRAPTMSLYDELIPKPTIKMKVGKDGAEGGETELTVDTSNLVRKMIVDIKGLIIDIEGKNQIVIKTGNDLFSTDAPAMLAGLTDELGRYFQEILISRKVDTKN
jgi:hypothetical protein